MKILVTLMLVGLSTSAIAQQAAPVVPSQRPPSEDAVSYVHRQSMPSNPVQIQEKLVIGEPIPDNIVLLPIPDEPSFKYVVINQQRVIVDDKTRKAVQFVD